MTAPVQEPSTQRNFQGTAWATRQLARRPQPISVFVPTVFRARQTTGSFTTLPAGGGEAQLRWNVWENGDDEVFTAILDLPTGLLLESVEIHVPGVYSISYIISIQDIASTAQLVMIYNDSFDDQVQVVHPGEIASEGGDYLLSDTRTLPPLLPDHGGDGEIWFEAAQNGAASRTTNYGTMFEIVYFGPFRSEEVS